MTDPSDKLSKRFVNHLARAVFVGFAAGIVVIVVASLLDTAFGLEGNDFVAAVFISGFLLIVASAAVLVFLMVGRDLIEWKRKRWRFSLGTLLIGMTVLAIMLGLAATMSRMAN